MKNRFLEAGKIVNTHGIRGELKIVPWTDSPEFLLGFKKLYLGESEQQVLRVRSARIQKSLNIIGFEGIDDINAAMRLKDRIIYIDRNDVQLPDGRYFVSDLVGSVVKDENGREIGKLVEVMDMPAGQIYLVQDGETEHQIPAVPEFILNTDIEAGIITVHLIEGM